MRHRFPILVEMMTPQVLDRTYGMALTYRCELLLTIITCLTSASICGKNVTPAGAPGNQVAARMSVLVTPSCLVRPSRV
jgi:hypothetical protein